MSYKDYEQRARLFCARAGYNADENVPGSSPSRDGMTLAVSVLVPYWRVVAERMEEQDLINEYLARGELVAEYLLKHET